MTRRLPLVGLWLCALLAPAVAAAQPINTPPPAPPGPNAWILQPGFDFPLTTAEPSVGGASTQGTQLSGSPRAQVTLRFSPRETWFARITGYVYLNSDRKRPWNPDFTYSFGYDSWRPGTFGLTYDNYGGNRWHPDSDRDERVTRFDEGTVTASYKFRMPGALESLFEPDGERRWSASVAAHLVPRYPRQNDTTRGEWKRSLSFGVRSRFYKRLYVEGRAFVYPTADQQQPWDPDFTYGLGWFDWRPGTLSIQYGNYSGNRWFGRSKPGTGAVRNGSITMFFTTAW